MFNNKQQVRTRARLQLLYHLPLARVVRQTSMHVFDQAEHGRCALDTRRCDVQIKHLHKMCMHLAHSRHTILRDDRTETGRMQVLPDGGHV